MNLEQWIKQGAITRPIFKESRMTNTEEKKPNHGSEITIQQGNYFYFADYSFQFLRIENGAVVLHVQQRKGEGHEPTP